MFAQTSRAQIDIGARVVVGARERHYAGFCDATATGDPAYTRLTAMSDFRQPAPRSRATLDA